MRRSALSVTSSAHVPGRRCSLCPGDMPQGGALTQAPCANHQGFSLHAAVRCRANERQRMEQLCRYITRPALANELVQINSAGHVVLKLKIASRDGTNHIVMSPMEFMQRMAALVPRLATQSITAWPLWLQPLECARRSPPSVSRPTLTKSSVPGSGTLFGRLASVTTTLSSPM